MNEMTIGCGCGGRYPVPRTYPFMMAGNYACDCCHQMYQPNPENKQIPASGMIKGSLFTIVDNDPILIQRDLFEYGTKLSVSENVRTQVTRRADISCINLISSFDLTDGQIITNDSLYSFLCHKIGTQFETNKSVLSILKSGFVVRVYFNVLDDQGSVLYSNHVQSSDTVGKFHYTDVRDYFIESLSNVMVTNIEEGLNPFYAFTDNNTKINQSVDTIASTQADETILVAASDINWSTQFQANLTTRLKISFKVFTSNMIIAANVYDVWTALFEPVEDVIETLKNSIQSMSETIEILNQKIETQNETIAQLARRIENMYYTSEEYTKGHYFHKGVITWLVPGKIYQTTEAYTTTNDEGTSVAAAFDSDIAMGKLVPLFPTQPVDAEVGE